MQMNVEIFFIGLVLTLIFVAVTGLYPGGIIVPGYLVLFIDQPWRLAGTLAAVLLTIVIYRLASRYLILFGRRRFVFLILTGALFAFLFSLLLPHLSPEAIEFRVIGWVIPGLIAGHFDRQGTLKTLAAIIIMVTLLFFINQLCFLIF